MIQIFSFFFLFLTSSSRSIRSINNNAGYNTKFPQIVHLIYIPWKNNILKEDYNDFDRSYAQNLETKYHNKGWEIKMWDRKNLDNFLENNYPEYTIPVLEKLISRPTQLVDFYRWLVVAHFGGIYIQYDSRIRKNLRSLLPSEGKSVRLYTEAVIDKMEGIFMANENPLRNGRPEEEVRVANQIFSAMPNDPYIWATVNLIHSRLLMLPKPKTDYEILYHGANAFVSELWDNTGRHYSMAELVPLNERISLFIPSSRGSWRTDNN